MVAFICCNRNHYIRNNHNHKSTFTSFPGTTAVRCTMPSARIGRAKNAWLCLTIPTFSLTNVLINVDLLKIQKREERFKIHVTSRRPTKRHKSRGSTNLRNLCSKLECRLQNYAKAIKIQISDKAKHLCGLVYIICSKYSLFKFASVSNIQKRLVV